MEKNLSVLSDAEIIQGLKFHVQRESEATEQVIRHFAEVERRVLYAGLGYSSMFDYACRGLGYSASAAMRRISAARAGVRVPEIFECLEKGEITLSTVGVMAGVIGNGDGKELLEKFKGKTCEEAKEIAAFMQPVSPSSIRDRISTVVVNTPRDERQSLLGFDGSGTTDEKNSLFRSEVEPEKSFQISFAADEDFMKLLKRAQELVFHGSKEDLALKNVLGKALGVFVEQNCPKEREQRRNARKEKAKEGEPQDLLLEQGISEIAPTPQAAPPRRIPVALRDKVLARYKHCCSFVGPTGVACGSRRNLEIDHIVPFAVGGETRIENLRVLCSVHNLAEARDAFGSSYVGHRISERRI